MGGGGNILEVTVSHGLIIQQLFGFMLLDQNLEYNVNEIQESTQIIYLIDSKELVLN